MQITYHGELGFRIKGEAATLALALEPKAVSDENIVVTRAADDQIKAKKEQIVMDWPGEYESRGVAVMIIPVGSDRKGRIVKILIDDMSIGHLTDVSDTLSEADEAKVGNIDILFVPVGAKSKLSAKSLTSIIETIEPRLVIPMNFAGGEQLEFAKNLGLTLSEEEDVLKVKKSDLPSDRMDVKVLKVK